MVAVRFALLHCCVCVCVLPSDLFSLAKATGYFKGIKVVV